MAGKKDIVEQALKLVMGGAEKAAPKVVGTDAAGRPMLDFRGAVVSHFTDPESAADIWSHGYRQVGDGYYGRAVSFTPNREYGRQFGGIETNAVVSPEAKILDSGNSEHSKIIQRVLNDRSLAPTNPRPGQKTWDQKFRELGYDGLYDPGAGDLFIYNPSKVKPLPPEKSSGGRIAKGPGGWLVDVVKMAGKVISGEGEDAAKAGIRAYQGSPHNFAAERLVRFPTGKEEYLVGQPDVLPDAPEGAEVLQDFPLGRMRMDKIGTGEGAQAYGDGLYFAEREGVAKGYRDALSPKNYLLNAPEPEIAQKYGQDVLDMFSSHGGDPNELKDTINRLSDQNKRDLYDLGASDVSQVKPQNDWGIEANLVNRADRVNRLQGLLASPDVKINPGHMYEVNINADPDAFLDWDKPVPMGHPLRERVAELGMQGSGALNAADRNMAKDAFLAARNEQMTGAGLHNSLSRSLEANRDSLKSKYGEEALFAKPTELARRELLSAGIPGIKYLDAGSRYTPANLPDNPIANEARRFLEAAQGDSAKALQLFRDSNPVQTWAGPERDEITKVIKAAAVPVTRNYVVFDDKLISIIRKYGIAGASAMLGYNLMEQLDPKQALAASMADQDYQSSRPQRSMGGNNSISGALNVARGLNGGE